MKDVLPNHKEKQPKELSLAEQWAKKYLAEKPRILSLAFSDANDAQSNVATFAIRMAYGLQTNDTIYEALIEWAHTGKKPESLEKEDLTHLLEQGFVTIDLSAPSQIAMDVIALTPSSEGKDKQAPPPFDATHE